MKYSLPVLSAFLLMLVSVFANAAIVNLPNELKGAVETQIENSAAEELSEFFNCEVSLSGNGAIAGEFVLEDGEQQDEEYAEYPGELSAFTLVSKVTLTAKKGKAADVYECTMRFNLYDEKAYDAEFSSLKCAKVK